MRFFQGGPLIELFFLLIFTFEYTDGTGGVFDRRGKDVYKLLPEAIRNTKEYDGNPVVKMHKAVRELANKLKHDQGTEKERYLKIIEIEKQWKEFEAGLNDMKKQLDSDPQLKSQIQASKSPRLSRDKSIVDFLKGIHRKAQTIHDQLEVLKGELKSKEEIDSEELYKAYSAFVNDPNKKVTLDAFIATAVQNNFKKLDADHYYNTKSNDLTKIMLEFSNKAEKYALKLLEQENTSVAVLITQMENRFKEVGEKLKKTKFVIQYATRIKDAVNQKTIENAETELKHCEGDLEKLKKQIQEEKNKSKTHVAYTAGTALDNQKSELFKHFRRLELIMQEIDETRQEDAKFLGQIKDLELPEGKAKKDLEKSKIQEIEGKKSDIRKDLRLLQKQTSEKEAEIDTLRKQLLVKESELVTLQVKTSKKDAEIGKLNEELVKVGETVKKELDEQLESVQKERANLHANVAAAHQNANGQGTEEVPKKAKAKAPEEQHP